MWNHALSKKKGQAISNSVKKGKKNLRKKKKKKQLHKLSESKSLVGTLN